MSFPIKIVIGGKSFAAELFDTEHGIAVRDALPIEVNTDTWGDEFYFPAGLGIKGVEGATTDVNVGDLAYWPQGDCLCVFFGPTPMSSSDKPVPASEVHIVGKVIDDPTGFKDVISANPIRWENA